MHGAITLLCCAICLQQRLMVQLKNTGGNFCSNYACFDKQGLCSLVYSLAYVAFRSCNRGIRCLFGDQTLFCRAADFKAVGGFQNDLPIMEDVDLCIRMHEAGTIVNAHESHHGHNRRGRVSMVMNPVNETSGRRLSDWGALRATYVHFYIALRWYFGAHAGEMYKIYHSMYTDNHR